eukprot:1769367-Amphidinium_carterae.1
MLWEFICGAKQALGIYTVILIVETVKRQEEQKPIRNPNAFTALGCFPLAQRVMRLDSDIPIIVIPITVPD